MKVDYDKKYNERIEKAQIACASLSKYNATICEYDRTAVIVPDITEKQLHQLCAELHCSGFYAEKVKSGIITNFGMYE